MKEKIMKEVFLWNITVNCLTEGEPQL